MWITFGVLVLIWIGLNLKKSRADGKLARVHPYRRMMPFIMQGRNESIVYYDDAVDVEKLLAYVKDARKRFHCDVTHCLVAAVSVGLGKNPTMNNFVSGRRVYERNERQISFSMKRQKKNKKAKIAVVKLEMESGETFEQLCARIQGQIGEERSDKKTYMDKELALFTSFPRPLMNLGVKFFQLLDYYNLLPYNAFIKGDTMYTSVFVANLGSLGMRAAYHHLYEWGNCPLFLMVGKVEERAVVVDGEIVVKKILPLRYSYDERIDDGLSSSYGMAAMRYVLENPYEELGCVAEDGSDARPLAHEPDDAS